MISIRCVVLSLAAASAVLAQVYEGPAVLARGANGAVRKYGERAGKQTRIRAFIDLSAIYDTGFVPYDLDANGNIRDLGALKGSEVGLGAFGKKKTRFGSFGMDYRGTFRYYPGNQKYAGGTDHFLGMEIEQQANRKLSYEGHITAGTSNRVFSFGNVIVGSNLAGYLPISEVFDNRSYFLQGGASMTYQINRRSSLTVGSDAYGIRRDAVGLIGINGYAPRLGYGYRITRRTQVGIVYSFQHFDYPRAFGESDVHQGTAVVSYDFSRRWSMEVSGGAFRADTAGSRRVEADPVVQRILGVQTITESFARGVVSPAYTAAVRGTLKSSSLRVSFSQTASAGNGLTLLGRARLMVANYSYSPNKRTSYGLTSMVNSLDSLGNDVGGRFTSYGVGGTANHFLTRSIGLVGGFYYRHLDLPVVRTVRTNTLRINIGLIFSPGDFGLPVF